MKANRAIRIEITLTTSVHVRTDTVRARRVVLAHPILINSFHACATALQRRFNASVANTTAEIRRARQRTL